MTLRLLLLAVVAGALPLAAQGPDSVKIVRRSEPTREDTLAIRRAATPTPNPITSIRIVNDTAWVRGGSDAGPGLTIGHWVLRLERRDGQWVQVHRNTRDSVADSLQSTGVEYLQGRLSPFMVITAKDTVPMQRRADGSCDWTRYAKPPVMPPIGVMRMQGERHNKQCLLVYYRVIDKTPIPAGAKADTTRARVPPRKP